MSINKDSQKAPNLRFKGFTDNWEQRNWSSTVIMSTNMVDPKDGRYDNLPHIGPGNIESFSGRILNNVHTVKEDNLISGKFHFKENDIIYGKINPQLAKYAYVNFEGLASADTYVLNSKKDLDQNFLFFELQTDRFYKYTVSVSMRTGMPKVNRDELNQYKYLLPNNISEQRLIGTLFKNIDKTITLHQRKLDQLKQLKEALLQQMFPGKGETVPKLRFAGFEGDWEERKLGELGETKSGIGFPDDEQGGKKGIPFFKVSDMNNIGNEHELKNSNNYVDTEQLKRRNWKPIMNVPAVIFAKVGAAIMLNRKRIVRMPFLLDNNTMAYIFDDSWNSDFGKILFETIYLPRYAQVGALPSYNGSVINSIKVFIPNKKEQEKIGVFFKQLDNTITLQQRKLDQLQNMKQVLLQNMFI